MELATNESDRQGKRATAGGSIQMVRAGRRIGKADDGIHVAIGWNAGSSLVLPQPTGLFWAMMASRRRDPRPAKA